MKTDCYPLPECPPEKIGLSSRRVLDFVDEIGQKRVNLHSFIAIRHGRIFAEGYWKPYHDAYLHRMYSVSKSFTSTAIGLLCDEGKISLDDRVAKYFPDLTPPDMHPWIAECTVRDLLTMASPFNYPTYCDPAEPRWMWTFFNTKPDKAPGTAFAYDTCGTFILDAIVERVSGMELMPYLQKKVLNKLGFSHMTWCVKSPDNVSWGGSGVMATTRDLAKFGLFWLRGGVWNGERLLSEEYVRAATSKQIQDDGTDPNYSTHGYGYQIWLTRDGSFAFRGMGSQLCIMIPSADMVFACTGDTQGDDDAETIIFEALWKHLVEPMTDGEAEVNEAQTSALAYKLAHLALPVCSGEKTSPKAAAVNGATYVLGENPMGITKTRLRFDGDYGVWQFENAQGAKQLRFGLGMNVSDRFPQTGYHGREVMTPKRDLYCANTSGAWVTPNLFRLEVQITDDYLGNMTADFLFDGDKITVDMKKTAEWFLDEYEGHAEGRISAEEK